MAIGGGRREQKKLKAREALTEAAYLLFDAQGYEATTIDAIAERAGLSRRSFFRYFASKEAVAFPQHEARLERFRGLLAALLEQSTPGLPAVRAACLAIAQEYMHSRREKARQHRFVESSPALVVYELTLDQEVEKVMVEALRGPSKRADVDRRARLLAAATMAVVRATLREWYAQGCRTDLVTLGREALDLLERGFDIKPRRAATVAPPHKKRTTKTRRKRRASA